MMAEAYRHKSETALAYFTVVATLTHFVLETWYHFVWGQPLQALIVDYISNVLMLSAGFMSLRLRPKSAAGLLAAGWAFTLGFSWRSVFGRLEMLKAGEAPVNGEADYVLPLIATALAVVVIVFIWSLYLAWRQAIGRKARQGWAVEAESTANEDLNEPW
jgi:hypothetical protein